MNTVATTTSFTMAARTVRGGTRYAAWALGPSHRQLGYGRHRSLGEPGSSRGAARTQRSRVEGYRPSQIRDRCCACRSRPDRNSDNSNRPEGLKMRTTNDLVGGAASSVVPFVAIATEVTRFTRACVAGRRWQARALQHVHRYATGSPGDEIGAHVMGEVIQFIPKSALERARLIREARAIYESIFPTENGPANRQRDS